MNYGAIFVLSTQLLGMLGMVGFTELSFKFKRYLYIE